VGRQEMSKEEMIAIIYKLLKTDRDLGFLSKLDEEELKILVACIRDRIGTEK
jgi:hypothetical protein